MDVNLPFVVGGSAAEEIAVANGRFKGGRGPEIEWFGRLHVVMAIEEDRWLPGSFQGFGIDERMQVCRNDLHGFESGGAQVFGNPARAALDVRFVLALGANAWDAQEFIELGEVLVARTVNPLNKIHRKSSGDGSPLRLECKLIYAKCETNVAAADESTGASHAPFIL